MASKMHLNILGKICFVCISIFIELPPKGFTEWHPDNKSCATRRTLVQQEEAATILLFRECCVSAVVVTGHSYKCKNNIKEEAMSIYTQAYQIITLNSEINNKFDGWGKVCEIRLYVRVRRDWRRRDDQNTSGVSPQTHVFLLGVQEISL